MALIFDNFSDPNILARWDINGQPPMLNYEVIPPPESALRVYATATNKNAINFLNKIPVFQDKEKQYIEIKYNYIASRGLIAFGTQIVTIGSPPTKIRLFGIGEFSPDVYHFFYYNGSIWDYFMEAPRRYGYMMIVIDKSAQQLQFYSGVFGRYPEQPQYTVPYILESNEKYALTFATIDASPSFNSSVTNFKVDVFSPQPTEYRFVEENRPQTLTNKKLILPKINEDIDLTKTSTEINNIIDWKENAKIKDIIITIDEGTEVLSPGFVGTFQVNNRCRILSWTLLTKDADTGSIAIDIKKSSYANYPTGLVSICGTGVRPNMINAKKNTSDDLTGWDVDINQGDILHYVIKDALNLSYISLILRVELI